MAEQVSEWKMMWGAKVKWPSDMPDDILKDAIDTSRKYIEEFPDYEKDGVEIVKHIKKEFDERWTPHWHVIVGKNFGCFATHEARRFVYFYLDEKAVMLYKVG